MVSRQPKWTAFEHRFVESLYTQHAPLMSMADWQVILEEFNAEQPRHLPGGNLHDTEPWPARECNAAGNFKAYFLGYKESEEKRRIDTAHALLELSRDPTFPRESIRLPESHITIPKDSVLLPDGGVRLPDGRHLQIKHSIRLNSQVQNPFADVGIQSADGRLPETDFRIPEGSMLLPNGQIRLPDGRELVITYPRNPNPQQETIFPDIV